MGIREACIGLKQGPTWNYCRSLLAANPRLGLPSGGEIKEAAEKNGVASARIPGNKKGLEDVKTGAPPVPGEKVV
jgi:hypothetical protein